MSSDEREAIADALLAIASVLQDLAPGYADVNELYNAIERLRALGQ